MTLKSSQDKAKENNIARYAMAFSIFCLALALIYFSWQIGVVSKQIPAILKSIEATSVKIEPVLDEAAKIRKQVPIVLEEVRQVREQVPAVITEVQAVRQQLPAILERVDDVNNVAQSALPEVKLWRPMVPQILEEVEAVRTVMPAMLDRADTLVANARTAGKEASKGAVTGFVTGIITAPFEMVGAFGEKVFGLSEEEQKQLSDSDMEIIEETVLVVAPSEQVDFSKSWNNPETGANGKVTLLKIGRVDGRLCKVLDIKINKKKEIITDKTIQICLNQDNKWERAD